MKKLISLLLAVIMAFSSMSAATASAASLLRSSSPDAAFTYESFSGKQSSPFAGFGSLFSNIFAGIFGGKGKITKFSDLEIYPRTYTNGGKNPEISAKAVNGGYSGKSPTETYNVYIQKNDWFYLSGNKLCVYANKVKTDVSTKVVINYCVSDDSGKIYAKSSDTINIDYKVKNGDDPGTTPQETTYTIKFTANNGNVGTSSMPSNLTYTKSSKSLSVPYQIPISADGKIFAGWSFTSGTVPYTNAYLLKPGQALNVSDWTILTTNTLYAIWVPKSNHGTMDDPTAFACNNYASTNSGTCDENGKQVISNNAPADELCANGEWVKGDKVQTGDPGVTPTYHGSGDEHLIGKSKGECTNFEKRTNVVTNAISLVSSASKPNKAFYSEDEEAYCHHYYKLPGEADSAAVYSGSGVVCTASNPESCNGGCTVRASFPELYYCKGHTSVTTRKFHSASDNYYYSTNSGSALGDAFTVGAPSKANDGKYYHRQYNVPGKGTISSAAGILCTNSDPAHCTGGDKVEYKVTTSGSCTDRAHDNVGTMYSPKNHGSKTGSRPDGCISAQANQVSGIDPCNQNGQTKTVTADVVNGVPQSPVLPTEKPCTCQAGGGHWEWVKNSDGSVKKTEITERVTEYCSSDSITLYDSYWSGRAKSIDHFVAYAKQEKGYTDCKARGSSPTEISNYYAYDVTTHGQTTSISGHNAYEHNGGYDYHGTHYTGKSFCSECSSTCTGCTGHGKVSVYACPGHTVNKHVRDEYTAVWVCTGNHYSYVEYTCQGCWIPATCYICTGYDLVTPVDYENGYKYTWECKGHTHYTCQGHPAYIENKSIVMLTSKATPAKRYALVCEPGTTVTYADLVPLLVEAGYSLNVINDKNKFTYNMSDTVVTTQGGGIYNFQYAYDQQTLSIVSK